jgi:TLD
MSPETKEIETEAEVVVQSTTTTMNERDVLLDRFPLNEDELDTLLMLYEQYDETEQHVQLESSFSSSQLLLVPELSRIFQTAVDTVFVVVGSDFTDDAAFYRKAKFLEASVSLCGRRGDRFLLEAVLSAAKDDNNSGVVVNPSDLASLVHFLCQACDRLLQTSKDDNVESLSLSTVCQDDLPQSWIDFFSSTGAVSSVEWKDWANRTIPCVAQAVSTVFHSVLLGTCRPQSFQLPSAQDCLLWKKSHEPIPMQLALMGLGGPWKPIFRSDEDGLSFRTFQEALTSFCGPTVILIETVKGESLGYFSDIPWKLSPNWFSGDGESFLFRLRPSWNVYCTKDDGLAKKYHQFLNLPNSRRVDSLVGLAVGGVAPNVPRLHISMSLENCEACSFESVFDSGPLLASEEETLFDVDSLEVWAVRIVDDESFERSVHAGECIASGKESARQRLAKVDRAEFVNDFTSGAFMNTLFQHRTEARGRAEFVADDEGGGYFVEGKQPSQRGMDVEE